MLKVIVNSTPIIVLCGIGNIDDNAAKKTAKYLGLTVTGTLGILLKAKSQGIVQRVDILLAEMERNGFYIDSRLEAIVLEQAGERPGNQ